jgi:phosphonatase-like hydrolase
MGNLRNLDLVVFDMAGTTVEGSDDVAGAFSEALRENEIPFSGEELGAWRGASKREVVRHFVEREYGAEKPGTRERVERAYSDFRRLLEARYADGGARAIEGAEETFEWLKEKGVRVALTTGFYREVTDLILRSLGWDGGAVDASVCGDDAARGRPAPYMVFRAMELTGAEDVRRVAVVGDTPLDLRAGANAGAGRVVGVLTGGAGIEALGKEQHTHLLPSVAELPALFGEASA